ncbi:DUF930 domain-containing protein, partial [Rhizobium leguminosarum]|uniref:DUF930 domain-containing protein n=1 Tax=Rhizobium leguminosarum TaxID=384 RepID=UPI0010306598
WIRDRPPPPPPPPEAAKPQPESPRQLSVTRPVFEFGDKNTGPMKSNTGNSSQGEAKPTPVPPPSAPPQVPPEPIENAADKSQPIEQPPGNPVPKDVNLPELAAVDSQSERNAPSATATEEARTSFEPEKPSETKKPAQQKDEAPKDELPRVKTLFSQSANDDPVARAALGTLSRSERLNQLCTTELSQQIEHESPKYRNPDVPSYRPRADATVLQALETGAFSKGGNWYSVQFRCVVDADAMKILSFDFKFGGLIPRSQYATYRIRE